MRHFSAIVLVVPLALAIAGNSTAFAADAHSSELWHVATVTDPAHNKFIYCAAESSFDNGFSLAFARNRDLNTNLVVTFPKATLADHTKFRMNLIVDSNAGRQFVGFSANAQTLVIPLQHDRPIVALLQKGKLLELKGPEDSIKFALDGADDAIRRVQACVDSNLKAEASSAGGAPEARPVVVGGPVAANNALPASDGLVEPLPLPGVDAPDVKIAQAEQPQPASPPAPQASAKTDEQINEEAARAEAARLKQVTEAAQQQAAQEEAAKDQATKDEAVRAQQAQLQAQQNQRQADEAAARQKQAADTAQQQAARDEATKQAAKAQEAADQMAAAKDQAVKNEEARTQQAQLKAQQDALHQDTLRQATDDAAAKAALAKLDDESQATRKSASAAASITPAPQPAQPQAALTPGPAPAVKERSLAILLASAGLPPKGATTQGDIYNWKNGPVSASERPATQPFLDAMLDDIDAREKSCKSAFSSSIGAPVQRGNVTFAEVTTRCAATATTLLYYEKTGFFNMIGEQQGAADQGNTPIRQRVEASLAHATNYK